MADKRAQMITIKTTDGCMKIPALVLGRLAVHKTAHKDEPWDGIGFTITEVSSGRAVIYASSYHSFQDVKKVAQEMLPLFDDCPSGDYDATDPRWREWGTRRKSALREYREDLS